MADLAFTPQHNMVPYLEQTEVWMLRLSIKRGDSLVRASTTASLDAQQDNSNIAKTQSKETLNLPNPQGEGLGNIVRSREDKMERAIELTDPVPQTPHYSPLSGGHTPGSDEGSMTLKELMDFCTTLSQKVLDLEKDKTAQAKEIASLKKRVTKRHDLGRRNVSKQRRKNFKSEQKFQDINDLVDEDKGSDEKGGSTTKTVSTARPDISVASQKLMKNHKAKEKGVAFKDIDDSARPIRSITTLQPLPTIDPKDKGSEEDEKRVRSRKKRAAGSSIKQKSPKKQKVNDQESIDSDKELRKCLKVLGTMVAGDVHVYKLTRLDGSYRHFSTFFRILKVLDRQDVLDLHKIVMERFLTNDPECYDLILWGYLKTLMESSEDDKIWRNQQDWKLLS
nr:hypothetical protein [Tanacetum cinerariifolium]